ncbi:hypothetical protein BVC80_4617g1 [Macleaya cordata]|uniref:Uncharacterized protein n=1 Tax=Macleaya cordata TaxID=56857 RepID=A0A200Q7V3_MACCD|nr:hypothetical protein BVC80_4617g1 [Macleaya cordata]
MDDKILPDKKLKKKVNPLAESTVGGKTKKKTLAYFLQSKRKNRTKKAVKDAYKEKNIICTGDVVMVGNSEKGDNGGKTKGISNGISLEENVEKPKALPRKRKRGADREVAKPFLLSPEKGLSMLRPRKEVAFFRKVELSESDFGRIIGKLMGDINHVENHEVVNCGNGTGETKSISEVAVETDEKLSEAQAIEQQCNPENEETSSGSGIISGNASTKIYVSVCNAEPLENDAVMIKKLTSKAAKNLEENANIGNINMQIWTFNCENNHNGTKYTPKDASKQTNVMSDATQVSDPNCLSKDENHETLIDKKLKSQTGEAAGSIVIDKETGEVNILEGVLGTKHEGGISDPRTLDSQPLSDDETKKNKVDTHLVTLKNYVRNGHEKVKSNCIYLS